MPAGTPPPCRRIGPHCLGLEVTLRVAALSDDPTSGDHEATWLLGHNERIRFGPLRRRGRHLYARAFLDVPCRFAQSTRSGVRCRAHGFRGVVAVPPTRPAVVQLADGRFAYVQAGRRVLGRLPRSPERRRSLPVVETANPCATAPCRTADGRRGAACCRDLQLEILCPPSNRWLEALIRARRSPYLCKVERESADSLGVEVISACGYLGTDGVSCSLHDRRRRDGRTAKPDLCYQWPEGSEVFHRDCALINSS
jgi:hypothetical protein